jgi:hypothetical protein
MLLFQKLITGTQISKPPELAMDHNSIKSMILLPFKECAPKMTMIFFNEKRERFG